MDAVCAVCAAHDKRFGQYTVRRKEFDAAIHQYRQLPVLEKREDPLQIWRRWPGDMPGSALAPLLPLAASVAAVPATEAICELLFIAEGQVLTSSRLRLLGQVRW